MGPLTERPKAAVQRMKRNQAKAETLATSGGRADDEIQVVDVSHRFVLPEGIACCLSPSGARSLLLSTVRDPLGAF
jgi:hypothetical protein